MEKDELVRKMRNRIERCRRLARSTTDQRTAGILNQMADEGEADIQRLMTTADRSLTVGDAGPSAYYPRERYLH